jgi:NOL1/NOP2/fmu family ribosome biogenesis protein
MKFENVEPVKIPGLAFRKEVRIAIRQGFRMGKIDRKGYRLLMKAAYAPSQLQAFEDITILQMTGSSQGDEVERTADGKVNREVINWQELRPLLIALLQFFLEYLQDGGV